MIWVKNRYNFGKIMVPIMLLLSSVMALHKISHVMTGSDRLGMILLSLWLNFMHCIPVILVITNISLKDFPSSIVYFLIYKLIPQMYLFSQNKYKCITPYLSNWTKSMQHDATYLYNSTRKLLQATESS